MSEKEIHATHKKLISIVVPVFNEELNVRSCYDQVVELFQSLCARYDLELIFTDNHSSDRTFAILQEIAAEDSRVMAIRFSKNFGYQRSILTGYLRAHGEAVIQLDCDLQDPPALIVEFLDQWERGYQVVYGVRRKRKEGAGISLLRQIFYRGLNWLSDEPLPIDAGDFRLVDRVIVEQLRELDDASPYLRGQIASMGFRQLGITYDRSARQLGESKFRFRDLARLAIDGLINHSTVPLRLGTYVSQLVFVAACLIMLTYVAARLTIGAQWPAGFTTLAVLVLCSTSINALLLGIQGEYISRIYKQVRKGPITIIENQVSNCYDGRSPASHVEGDRRRAAMNLTESRNAA
ncbi:glycosyl transferase family 2 [Pirellula staleyi DSM 6068]|uniref:Glycosyl transferase family 2 n=1 Tax=Pirellula staleyi (strain ATCC 27377 / DSM 6068 / ICPB 4128) TaxID=530564 RepID=D2R669_PIRSD|nr:glycosyltransferase family 2 protein [Pirellula staleyi]ADB19154.1 glycosyl transferase family 2 [Pirellula staleyi DSM 6068]